MTLRALLCQGWSSVRALTSRPHWALAPLVWSTACWSPSSLQAPPVEASILLFVQDGQFQGVLQGNSDLRAALSPPAVLLGYDRSPSGLGIPEGPLPLVAEGDELPVPLWAYVLEEDGWREATKTLRDENLFKRARVQSRSICGCASEGGCFDQGAEPNCVPCPQPSPPFPPQNLTAAEPASCPAFWSATPAPGQHFELCAPPSFLCADGVTTAGECRPLIIGCPDGFPPGDYDSYVRAGSNGNGSRTDPFGDLDAARAATGTTPARIALATGLYQLPEPYQGPALELYGCDPQQTRLGDVELRSGLRLEGVGFAALTGRGAELQLVRSQGGRVELSAGSRLIATDVDLEDLAVRSSTASGSGWRVRGELLLAGPRLEVRDLLGSSLRVTDGVAELDEVVLDGGLQVAAPGRLRLTHAQVDGRPGVVLGLAGAVDIEDSLLRTNNGTISVSRADAHFLRTWFVGPVVVSGIISTLERVAFEVEAPAEGELPRFYHFRTDRTSTLRDVYASGPSQAGLSFASGASSLNRAWLQNYGGNVLSLSGSGQLEVNDLRAETKDEAEVACAVVSVTSGELRGRRLDLATSGAGLVTQVNGEIAVSDVRMVQRGRPRDDCRRPFLPLANEGVGAAAYDRSRLQLERFEILNLPRGIVLNNSSAALTQGLISTPIAFSISEADTQELGLLRGVRVEGANEICEAVLQ